MAQVRFISKEWNADILVWRLNVQKNQKKTGRRKDGNKISCVLLQRD